MHIHFLSEGVGGRRVQNTTEAETASPDLSGLTSSGGSAF